jgi:hypothetical protein
MIDVIYNSEDRDKATGQPKGFREVDETEFARSGILTYTPRAYETRYVADPANPEGPRISVHMLHSILSHGFAISLDEQTGRVRYFRFGCEHAWRPATEAEVLRHGMTRGLNNQICDKCGERFSFDSTD